MQTTQNTPIGGGGPATDAPGADPNAPVEQPRRCGLCKHFARWTPMPAEHGADPAATHPRGARFGTCTRWHDIVVHGGSSPATDPADRGPVDALVGDLFGCVFFEARL